jgi:undecaprenyl-diphosphatase
MRWLRAEGPRLASPRWERVLEWDRTCALTLNRSLSTPYQRLWLVIDRLGSVWTWIAAMLVIALTGGTMGVYCAAHMFAGGGCALVCYKLVKNVACRARPCVIVNGVRRCADPLDEWSFPSGHVLHAVAFSTIAMAYYPALVFVLLPFLVLMGVSRIALGLHYPSDVVAGAAIGAAISVGSFVFV